MVLTSSDIGTKPEEIEWILTTKFKTARSWNAVLLIDEADVFMERRTTTDLTRNSLVAGKRFSPNELSYHLIGLKRCTERISAHCGISDLANMMGLLQGSSAPWSSMTEFSS